MSDKQQLGKWGEGKARIYLERKGVKILDSNFRTPYGELDLIGLEASQVVFFEVKTRSSDAFGFGEQSITKKKQEHLIDSAEAYIQEHPHLGEDWRIDAIVIDGNPSRKKNIIRWFKNAVSGE
jgi:putative endonuclease